jgi:DNA-binding beta-propeller fold protein YncE
MILSHLLLITALVQQATPQDLVYVCNQDAATITIIDAKRNAVVDTVDLQQLGFSATAKPHHVVVEPDGSFWYVSLIGDNVVLKLDRNNRVVGRAPFDQPGMLALEPDQDRLYVSHSMTAVNPAQRIGAIERSTMDIEEVEVFFPRPHAIAVDPRGTHVYVGSLAENRIVSVNLETEELTFTPVEGGPAHTFVQFAVSPTAPILVVTTELTGRLLVFDITTPGVLRLIKSVEVNAAPWDPVFSVDGRYVFFGNQRTNTITVVETGNWTIAKVIHNDGISDPYGSITSPDGRYVYIANRHVRDSDHAAHGTGAAKRVATVVVIDTNTLTVSKVIDVPGDATGIGTRHPTHKTK